MQVFLYGTSAQTPQELCEQLAGSCVRAAPPSAAAIASADDAAEGEEGGAPDGAPLMATERRDEAEAAAAKA